jgi:F-type H+-transporting ATPase subunit epsilon
MRKETSGEGASGCKVSEFRFQPARGSSDLKPESGTAGIVYSEDVEMVTLPGIAGQMGIYPRHVSLISQMVPGEMIVHKDGRDSFVATGGGLIEVTANRVSILTDLAIPADRIDEAKAEKARQRAEARLREKLSDEQVAAVNASLTRALVQLRVTVA